MAISFSRPDPSSPASVADANFSTSRRGFDQNEVRDFLRMVAAELARLQERERYLDHEMRSLRQQRAVTPAELDEGTIVRLLGEETARIVQVARESANAVRIKAEDNAERTIREATEAAHTLRESSEAEAAQRRRDAEVDAEAEVSMAKQQGREMVEEARAYRERALGELAKRRDLARQQIDQLLHGRDQLVQSFERARLVAVDVVAELTPLGELDEYVNLSPTTGPVPMMVPRSRLGEASTIGNDALAARARAVVTRDAPVVEDDDVSPDEPTDDVPAAMDVTSAIDAVPADPRVTDEAAAPAPSPLPEATVLAFPGTTLRSVPPIAPEDIEDTDENNHADDATDESSPDEIDDDDVTATDVDDLFARLRTQTPTATAEPPTTSSALGFPTASAPVRSDDDTHDPASGAPSSSRTRAGRASDTPSEQPDRERSEPDTQPETPPTTFQRRGEALTPLIVASGRKLKRVLADEQNAVLDRLRRAEPVRTLDDIVPVLESHLASYFGAIAGELLAAAEVGAESMGGAMLDVSTSHGGGHGVLSPVEESMRVELVEPLRDRLEARIAAGEGDNEAVTKSIRAVYREWKTRHIDNHLDDLLRLAHGRGAYAGLDEGEPCRWTFDPEVGACSDCEDNALQGAVPAGTAFPTGHVTAPAHAGCRCLLARSDG